MLKSNWKDLPDWKNADNYAFLDGQPPVVWAWEFLRRHPIYRKHWRRLIRWQEKVGNDWMVHPCATVYRPRKKRCETVEAWERRVGNETGIHPKPQPLRAYLGSNWSLRSMYDPYLPYTQGVRFPKPQLEFPRMVFTPEEFMELVEDEELERGAGFQRVVNEFAMVAFDLTHPLDAQLKIAAKQLFNWQEEMETTKRIVVNTSSSPKTTKWLRHLRVLDARRANPPAKYAEIARVLEGDDESNDYLHKQGDKFLSAARKAVTNYRSILKYSGTPSKDKKS